MLHAKVYLIFYQPLFKSQDSHGSVQSHSNITLDPRKLQAMFGTNSQLSPPKKQVSELEQMKQRLGHLDTSVETILTESKNLNKVSINVKGKLFKSFVQHLLTKFLIASLLEILVTTLR